MNNLLTVIVPTRERPETLAHCLKTICWQDDPRLEIIVSDNAGGPETKRVTDSFSYDSRLRYIRPPQRLGMTEHWEFALAHAKGNWVTIIGDDDSLMPGAVKRLFDMVDGTPIKAVSSQTHRFRWPLEGNGADSKLVVRLGSGIERRDSREWLIRVLNGTQEFAALPCLYTGGFLHRDVIDEIKAKTDGKFFNSAMPDVYSGLAVASVVGDYLYSWEPLAMAGISRSSNSKAYSVSTVKNIKETPFFKENGKDCHPALGDGLTKKSVQIFVYESFLQSAHLRGDEIKTTMGAQLALAVAKSSGPDAVDILAYCRDLANRNALDFSKIISASRRMRAKNKVGRISEKILSLIPCGKLSRKTVLGHPDLKTVYDATVGASCVLDHEEIGHFSYIPMGIRNA